MARKLIYSMMVSLDGYIAGPDGSPDWGVVDEPIHRFAGEQFAELGAALWGRKVYEAMTFWETAEEQPDLEDFMRDFAQLYLDKPKVVVSTTLEAVVPNARLVRDRVVEEVAKLKAEDGGPIGLAGGQLAASLIPEGLVDEYRPIIHPCVLGSGTPYFPARVELPKLELLETKTFPAGHVYLRYRDPAAA
jgi:dihydrofolate reductase